MRSLFFCYDMLNFKREVKYISNNFDRKFEGLVNETIQAFGISNKNTLIGKFYKIEVYDSKENMNRLRKAELTPKN